MQKAAYFMDDNSLMAIETASNVVNCVALAGNVAKSITVPTGARFCRLSAGALFYYSVAVVATVAVADNQAGTAAISVPATVQPMFGVTPGQVLSVIAPASIVVSAEFWA